MPRFVRQLVARTLFSTAVAAFSCAALPNLAFAAPLDDATAALRAGDYEAALSAAEDLDGDERQAGRLLQAEVLRLTGHLDDAVDIWRSEARSRSATGPSRAAYGRYLVERGDWDAAIEVLDPAVEGEGAAYPPARYWRAMAFHAQGRRSRARLEFEDFVRAYNRGDAQTPEALLYVGMACHRLELFSDANAAFREALERDPDNIAVRLGWAQLFIEKYRPDEAATLLDEVLALNPSHPQALALKAAAEVELTYNLDEARRLAELALETDPNRAEAREVLASLAIDGRDYEGAEEHLEAVLERWPNRGETLAMLASIAWLQGDTDTYAELEERVRARNPQPAAFLHTVGQFAERNFRYDEALGLYQQAIVADAGFWPAYVSLGIAHSRAGDDGRALDFLRRAFDADPFNVQAYNMVELWETTLTDYRYVDDDAIDGLRYRFHRDELEVLRQYVPPAVQAAYRVYLDRYDFTPEMPVSIEVFADQATFGIRSVGLPMAPQHGICFGHVVTSRSPREGNFNWRQVIEHELSHVFSLQASNYRVPRWFTEGLAEYDTILSRPEWRRENDLALVQALQRNELIGVLGLNRAFVSTERPSQIIEAYFQASLLVEFIGERWGYDALNQMLAGWANAESTEHVIEHVLGVTVDELDQLFEDLLRERYVTMLGLLDPALWWYGDLEQYQAQEQAHPNDPHALAELAWAHVHAGDLGSATAVARRAIELDAREPLAHLLLAHVAYNSGDMTTARSAYRSVLDAGAESVSVHASLGDIALRADDREAALTHLTRAAELYPRDPEIHRQLASLYEDLGDAANVRASLARVAMLDEHDAPTLRRLASLLEADGELAQAFVFAGMAANVDPFNAELHPLYGRLAHANADWQVARRELVLALDSGPADRTALLRLLLDVYVQLGMSTEAEAVRREIAQ